MNQEKWSQNSILKRLTLVISGLIVIQSLLMGAFLIGGGVLARIKQNSYDNFSKVVSNRAGYLRSEMGNRWSNIDLYAAQITEELPLLTSQLNSATVNTTQFFLAVEPVLYAMMRATRTTDCFVILNDAQASAKGYSALYLRDEDPQFTAEHGKDISLLVGPAELTAKYTAVDDLWQYKLALNDENGDFYHKPYAAAQAEQPVRQATLLGYWSKPFRLYPEDEPRITYSMPLLDKNGTVHGVIGVGISVSYLYQRYLPATELAPKDSLGYIIGYGTAQTAIQPVTTYGAYQQRLLDLNAPLDLTIKSGKNHIARLNQASTNNVVYACNESLDLYGINTPYAAETWQLIGLQKDSDLLSLVHKIENILWLSLLVAIILGVSGGIIVSYKFTKPIVRLAQKVRLNNPLTNNAFGKTGLYEIDELIEAIEIGNNNIVANTVKISQAMELANAPIGIFQYNDTMPQVMATSRLEEIFSLSADKAALLYKNKNKFIANLRQWMREPVDKAEQIYQIASNPNKWVKINLTTQNGETLGIAIDVTSDYEAAQQLKKERDYDVLTQLYGRRYFRDRVKALIAQGDLRVAAMIMLDLDHFKQVNDGYGHAWGDTYLKLVARYLREIAGSGCVIGRRSGDEFFAFAYDFSSPDEINTMLEKFYQILAANKIQFPDGSLKSIELSAGVAWFDPVNPDYDQLLERADQMLYVVKNKQKGYFGAEIFTSVK